MDDSNWWLHPDSFQRSNTGSNWSITSSDAGDSKTWRSREWNDQGWQHSQWGWNSWQSNWYAGYDDKKGWWASGEESQEPSKDQAWGAVNSLLLRGHTVDKLSDQDLQKVVQDLDRVRQQRAQPSQVEAAAASGNEAGQSAKPDEGGDGSKEPTEVQPC